MDLYDIADMLRQRHVAGVDELIAARLRHRRACREERPHARSVNGEAFFLFLFGTALGHAFKEVSHVRAGAIAIQGMLVRAACAGLHAAYGRSRSLDHILDGFREMQRPFSSVPKCRVPAARLFKLVT